MDEQFIWMECLLDLVYCADHWPFNFQSLSVMEQDKIDKLMLDMDGTENKCKPFVITSVQIG